jgi:uncharacterized protein YidB (DUF937 family)
MGMLEDLLSGAMGGQPGMGQPDPRQMPQAAGGGGMSGTLMALLPVVLAMLSNRGGGAQQSGYAPSGGGGLGDILGQMMGGGTQRGGGGLGDVLGGMLGGGAAGGGAGAGGGGLGGLLEQMSRAGYGDQARSWVGTGQNMPITPDALEQIFGRGGIGAIARQAGVSEADASQGLSELLPEVVNHVTPGGEVPDLDSLSASVGDLSRQLGLGR